MRKLVEFVKRLAARQKEKRAKEISDHIRNAVQVEEINGRLWITIAGYGVLKMQGDLDDCMYMLGKYRDLAVEACNERRAEP